MYLNLECASINQRKTRFAEDTKLMMREIKTTKGKRHIPMRHYKMYRMLPIAVPLEKRGNELAEVLSTTTEKQVINNKVHMEQLVPDVRYWFTDTGGLTFVNPAKKHNRVENILEFKEVKKVELLTAERKSGLQTRVVVPRPDLLAPKFLIVKDKWSFEKSVFRNYKRDTPKLLDACFDFDWRCSKISSLLSALSADKLHGIY